MAGVRVGMRRREAQGRCPGLDVLSSDISSEAREWEPAVAAVEAFAPGPEVFLPGQLALGARGPSRYFGGDLALATKVAATVEAVVAGEALVAGDAKVADVAKVAGDAKVARDEDRSGWAGCCRVGIADGLFAAGLAARQTLASKPLVVPKGGSAEFLAPLPVRVLAFPGPGSPAGLVGSDRIVDLADLLTRLGLKTLGAFAALPEPSVLGRFGTEGMLVHRLARGLEERPVRGRLPLPDWTVTAELDPPADQLQAAAFVGKALADELHSRLRDTGLVCTRLAIEAETEHGTSRRRSWRHDGALSAAAIGERVRWQLEGWALQAGQADNAARGGVGGPASGRSLGLGHQAGQADNTARGGVGAPASGRSLGLGPQAGQANDVRQGPPGPSRQKAGHGGRGKDAAPPWPGRLPGLAPAIVHQPPLPALMVDEEGNPVTVGSRGTASARPARLRVGAGALIEIGTWAGPWPVEERWWDGGGRRRARFQVCTVDGAAYLLAREGRRWWVEATYD